MNSADASDQTRLIEAEQALPDFPQLVKELIDNAIDAQAREIKLRISTDFSVTISDDGYGISDLQKAIQPHATSKLTDVCQILQGNLSSIGFRGEALAAIVALSEFVEIKSFCRTADSIKFLRTSQGTVSEMIDLPAALKQNSFTEICVRQPFYNHPIRLNQMERNKGKQLREILHIVYEYAILHAGKISIAVTRFASDQMMAQTLFESIGCIDVRDVVCRITSLSLDEFESNNREFMIKNDSQGFSAHGFLSNPLDGKSYTQKLGYNASQKLEGGHFGRSGGKFVFAAINKKPINVPNVVQRRVDSVYRRYTSKNCGGLILFIETSREFDMNMSISKRLVLLPFEKQLAAALEDEAEKILKPKVASVKSEVLALKSDVDNRETALSVAAIESDLALSRGGEEEEEEEKASSFSQMVLQTPTIRSFSPVDASSQEEPDRLTKRRRISFGSSQQLLCLTQADRTPKAESVALKEDEVLLSQNSNVESCAAEPDDAFGEVDWSWAQVLQRLETIKEEAGAESEDLLGRLKVLGSYRKSFIVCHDGIDSLYLVDQHAADEKFWFEKFNCETQISCQPLLKPIQLKLSTERLIILESLNEMHILDRNGYKVQVQNTEGGRRKVFITHMPTIKGLVLNQSDLLQLLQMIDYDNEQFVEGTGDPELNAQIWNFQKVGGLPRPPRVWNIIAMKSCKAAVKFGEQLSFKKMESIVAQMASLKHPWNCPHGRPTIKKLN